MTKKILSFFFALLLLCACGQKPAGSDDGKEEENQVTIEEYIDPVKDVFIFGELSEELQEGIKEANCNEEYKNYQFKMLGTKVFDGSLEDINGRKVRLADLDRFYLEIVSVNCSHCKAQLSVTALDDARATLAASDREKEALKKQIFALKEQIELMQNVGYRTEEATAEAPQPAAEDSAAEESAPIPTEADAPEEKSAPDPQPAISAEDDLFFDLDLFQT